MTATIHQIHLPPTNKPGTINNPSRSIPGWDHSIGDIVQDSLPCSDGDVVDANRSTLSFHAVAHGCTVVGTYSISPTATKDSSADGIDGMIKWRTSFDQQVVTVVSNDNGSVIASSTGSHVSLLRGRDGCVLATRQVGPKVYTTGINNPIGLKFVSSSQKYSSVVKDVLMIVYPASEDSSETTHQSEQICNAIIISNIDSEKINSSHMNRSLEGISSTSIDALSLEPPETCIKSIDGVFVSNSVIRLFVLNERGRISVHDYDVVEKTSNLVLHNLLDNLGLMAEEDESWELDENAGVCIDDKSIVGSFLLFSVTRVGATKICWLNVSNLSLVVECPSPDVVIYSLRPVFSFAPEKCLAAIFASASNSPRIHVIQSVIPDKEETIEDQHTSIIFSVNISSSYRVSRVDLCSPSDVDRRDPYTFRYITKFENDHPSTISEFSVSDSNQAGKVHYLLVRKRFEEAYQCISESIDHDRGKISSPIHKPMAVLWHFRHILSKGNISSKDNFVDARKCLHRLTVGAESGGQRGIDCLVDAAEFLLNWPKNQMHPPANTFYNTAGAGISAHEVCIALTAMTSALGIVREKICSSKGTRLEEVTKKLEARHDALKCLQSVVKLDGTTIFCDDPYLAVCSVNDLLHLLVCQGAFKSVEVLQKSQWGKLLPPDSVSSAALNISLDISPQVFTPWLCDIVIPSLFTDHPMLEKIRAWTCEAADEYDEKNIFDGIDSSINLLKAVSKATARLTAAMHSSFSHQLMSATESNDVGVITPRNDTSFSSVGSCRSAFSRPTVLNGSIVRGSNTKNSKISSTPRSIPSLALSPDTPDSSYFSLMSPMTEVPIEEGFGETNNYDCVEQKLKDALRLKAARDLGMEKSSLTLKKYSKEGEQFVVKELVKVISNQFTLDSNESALMVDKIRTYALSVEADFDDAVYQFVIELFGPKRVTPHVLLKAKSLSRWCASPSVSCLIVLMILQKAQVSIQRPPDLTELAKVAIHAATDSNVKSGLEEASRILAIHSIVRKYCGNGAQECFELQDVSHIRKLVSHVCRHVDVQTVLNDVLILSDAFECVSRLDACVTLIQRVMNGPQKYHRGEQSCSKADHCALLLRELYSKDTHLAERVGERITALCEETLISCKKMMLGQTFSADAKRKAVNASTTACSVLSVMQDQESSSKVPTTKLCSDSSFRKKVTLLLKEFQTVEKLQLGCDVYLTLEELRSTSACALIQFDLLKPCIDLILTNESTFRLKGRTLGNQLKPIMANARHWCAILCDAPSKVSQLWSRAVGMAASHIAAAAKNDVSGVLLLLEVSGVLDERHCPSSFHSVVSVALSLYSRAAEEAINLSESYTPPFTRDQATLMIATKGIAQAFHLLREHVVLYSPSTMLPPVLTFANFTELVCEVLVRSDLGIGEQLERYYDTLQAESLKRHHDPSSLKSTSEAVICSWLPSSPVLHHTWYIGDGLLLDPLEALCLGMDYCTMIMNAASNYPYADYETSQLHIPSESFDKLGSRGAHATSLRMLSLAAAMTMSQAHRLHCVTPAGLLPGSLVERYMCSLTERSLGGTESGLTSGKIDALLSISFLLHLPKETAFKMYLAALPSAIGKKDFHRILTLASLGAFCCSGTFSSQKPLPWSEQKIFFNQCKKLSSNAIWSNVLSQLGISFFDPTAFSKTNESLTENMLQGYSEDLIKNASKKHSPVVVLNLASRFAQVNGLETQVPPSLMITYLLSAPELEEIPNNQLNELMDTSTTAHSIVDIRLDLNLTETAVRRCLLRLHHKNQSLVLRKCLIRLEQNHSCSRDYDRHEMVLKLYSECLSKMREMLQSATQLKALEGEVTRIHQRQGALSLMSSIFRGYPPERKPKYNMLFQPLPDDPIHCQSDKRRTNVLGSEASSDVFDPLLSLHDVLLDDNGTNSIATSLQPLCKYLQLPSGYIHARALIVRLRKLKEAGESLPSVETSVITVLKKLESAADKAELAWWCSLQYPDGTKEQMGCLDLAHANATEASEEVETFSNHDESCMVDENKALERVKRIDETRAMYLDKKLVDDVLSQIKCSSSVRGVYKKIIAKIQECPVAGDKYRPEHLVRELLIEGSLAAAIASLDESDGFAVYHFRSLATLTHEACKSLSDRYSHINVGKCARALAHNWLVHGDEKRGFIQSQDEINYGGAVVASEKKDRTHDKDEELNLTSEFVMDIGMLSAGHQGWISEQSGDDHEPGVISSEEPSALKALSSLREASDNVCARVSLRIAFLICFAEDYHRLHESKSFDGNDENINGNIILKREKRKKNSSVARKFCFNKNNCFVGSHALDHARELLEIVFAKKESTIASCKFLFENSIVEDNTLLTGLSERSSPDNKPTRNKALSFAMRHRALRVATILCPTDVLLRVVSENGFINGLGDNCLEIYSFGTFIAMEIESMGLPLPHSDLVKISKMHFPSFARTIWRNHGGVSMPGLNGRLYLLLLQMGVRSKSLESAEWDFVKLIFSELMRLDLPRSLLLACECMIQSNAIQLAASSKMSDVLACVSNAAKRVCDLIAEEIQSSIKIGIELDAPQCLSTVERLVCVINVGHIENSIEFVKKLTALAIHCSQAGPAVLFKGLLEAASRIVNHMDDPVAFSAASSILSELSVGTTTIARPLPKLKPLPMRWKNDHSSPSVCSGEVEKFEKSFL